MIVSIDTPRTQDSQNPCQTGRIELQNLSKDRLERLWMVYQRSETRRKRNERLQRCCINAALLMLNRQPGNYMQIAAATV